MLIIHSIKKIKKQIQRYKTGNLKIGLVPTMGYLHAAHENLIEKCKSESDIAIVSIFVNPAQFSANEDLDKYPRDFKRDEKIIKSHNVDVLFYPANEVMYPKDYHTFVSVNELSKRLCGRSRPIHFQGVATIVLKLFNIIKPDIAVFGLKDFQQVLIIKQMVRDLNLDVKIVEAPIVREQDGIAMSSRNAYLTSEQRSQALCLNQALLLAKDLFLNGERNCKILIKNIKERIEKEPESKIDYIEIVNTEHLHKIEKIQAKALVALAVFIGKTRLIDNIILENKV